MYYNVGSTDFNVVASSAIDFDSQKFLWLGIFISMAIKTPLAPFHIWLSRAHAESPVGGSIILAGLILKLATYGYMRIILQFLPDVSAYYAPIVQLIAAITVVYASLVTLRQTDIKALVAYSSVGHMGIVVLGLFSNNIQGIEGAIVLSIAHAFVSPALFILVGSVLYDRYHTRIIRYYRGITTYIPVFSMFFLFFTLFNMAIPLSGNWLGELLALTGIFKENPVAGVLGSSGIILSAAYSIWLYNRVCFGTWQPYLNYTTDLNRREFILLIPLFIGTLLLGIYPNVVLENIHVSVSTLLYHG